MRTILSKLGVSVLLVLASCQSKSPDAEKSLNTPLNARFDTARWFFYQSNFSKTFFLATDSKKTNVHFLDTECTCARSKDYPANSFFFICTFVRDNIEYNGEDEYYWRGYFFDTIANKISERGLSIAYELHTQTGVIDSGRHFHPSLFDTTRFTPHFYHERDSFIISLKNNQSKMNKKSWLYQEAVRRGIFKE